MYIPFAEDSVIDAALTVRTDENDTIFHLLNDFDYRQFVFDTAATSNSWRAKDVFNVFAALENAVFGHKAFNIIDKRLFPNADSTKACLVHVKDQPNTQRTQVLDNTTLCEYIDVCYGPAEYVWCDDGCTVDCEWYTHTEMTCTTVWYESGGTPPSGGGSTWWLSTCGTAGANCGTSGWTSFDIDDFQNNYLSQGYGHFETWEVSDADETRIANWKSNKIDTTGLNPCVRAVLDKLLGGNNLIGRILAKMDNARPKKTDIEKFHLTVRTKSMGIDTLGRTVSGPISGSISYDTVYINTSVADSATEIAIARTLIHEIVHAYMNAIFKRYYNTLDPKLMTYDSIFNTYVDTLVELHTRLNLKNWVWDTANRNFQHDYMADKLLDRMVSALAFVDANFNSSEFYWDMTWGGLWSTKTMKTYWPNYFLTSPNDWPPANPSPSEDSTRGLKYALTQARLDSIRRYVNREYFDTAHAKGLKRVNPGCFETRN
jgi:hypothetical protein